MKLTTIGSAVAGVALSLIAGSAAFAQASASSTVTGSISLIKPITITQTANLSFGTFAVASTGVSNATVTVDNTGALATLPSGITAVANSVTSAPTLTVTGEPSRTFSITANGGSMTATSGTGTLTGGSATIKVGGSVGGISSSSNGTYSGTGTIQVAYN